MLLSVPEISSVGKDTEAKLLKLDDPHTHKKENIDENLQKEHGKHRGLVFANLIFWL